MRIPPHLVEAYMASSSMSNGHHENDQTTPERTPIPSRLFSTKNKPALSAFKELCSQTCLPASYPLSSTTEKNIPVYDASQLSLEDPEVKNSLQDEWNHILLSGPGVFVLRNMYPHLAVLHTTNAVYDRIISFENSAPGKQKGDHFAGAGTNSRIWNSFSKHCLEDPASFVQYYSNPWIGAISEAWLGPSYRVSAQVNIVRSGSSAQVAHRDYHLGFQTAEACQRFPAAVQVASQLLTLQGAVAHSDMPVDSGPTRLLPFSQQFREGYMAYRLPEFTRYFLENYVSLPLKMGDGLFFNPALFHAAGQNDVEGFERKANLIQVSGAFGKPMESIDSIPLVERCWDDLTKKFDAEGMSQEVQSFIEAVAEAYPFPTNLDKRPPAPGGMAPESEQDVVRKGLESAWKVGEVVDALKQMRNDSAA